MVRMIMLVKQARRELIRAIHPRVVNPVHLGGQTIANGVLMSVMAFMLIYGATILVLTMLMLYSGLDIVTAFTAVVGSNGVASSTAVPRTKARSSPAMRPARPT